MVLETYITILGRDMSSAASAGGGGGGSAPSAAPAGGGCASFKSKKPQYSYMWNDSLICAIQYSVVFVVVCLHVRDMTHSHVDTTHSCVRRDSFTCVKRLICLINTIWKSVALIVFCSLFVRSLFNKHFHTSTLLFHCCDMTLVHTRMSGLMTLDKCDMIHSHSWHDSFTSAAWLIYEINTAPSHAWYRAAKTHKMPYLYRSFPAKEPYTEWLFCENWPAT